MGIKIKYGIDFELERVKYTLKKLDWYNKQGYIIKLPKGITKESTISEIKKQINIEYNERKYKIAEKKINKGYLFVQNDFSNALKKYFNNVPNNFVVYLTNYGVGGSYDFPNKIIANLSQITGPRVIFHETIHILIEKDILKYKVEHWEKERIVDLILNSKEFGFLKYNHWQSGYNSAEKYIDKLFNKYFFKNQDEFFKRIKEVRK
jgi:hypothetical protein